MSFQRRWHPDRPRIEVIQALISERFNVTRNGLLSARRDRAIVDSRHAAMWLCRRSEYSWHEIGRAFGDRDHTTVISAIRRVDRLIEEKPEEWGALMTLLAAEAGAMGSPLVLPDAAD